LSAIEPQSEGEARATVLPARRPNFFDFLWKRRLIVKSASKTSTIWFESRNFANYNSSESGNIKGLAAKKFGKGFFAAPSFKTRLSRTIARIPKFRKQKIGEQKSISSRSLR
jgi:hypothetical protein